MNMTETCTKIANLLGCDCEHIPVAAGGSAIYRRYKMLARQGERTGFVPLVIYSSDTLLDALQQNLAQAGANTCVEHHASTLPQALAIDAAALLQARLNISVAGQDPAQLLGNFCEVHKPEGDDRLCQSCRNHAQEVLIAKCPTQNAWELPLFLPMGGFNDCPAPAEQAAVFRFWQDFFGATPAVVSYDIWELRVQKPPQQVLEAERLALQQFAFCPDLVLQAHRNDGDSVRALASHLVDAKAWYFWWD